MKFAILAAGEGSRLAEEGIQEPKPLVPLLGERLVDRLIRIFRECGADEVVIITNNLSPLTREHLWTLQAQGVPLKVVVKTTPSSMHSFYELMPLLGTGKFILTTVDTVFREVEFRHYAEAFQAADDVDGMMAVTDYVDDEKPLWISTTDDLGITGFHDSPELFRKSGVQGELRYISGGIYGLSDKCFPTLRRCIEGGQSRMRNFQRALVADGMRLRAFPFSKILDVDHASDIRKAEVFVKESSPSEELEEALKQ